MEEIIIKEVHRAIFFRKKKENFFNFKNDTQWDSLFLVNSSSNIRVSGTFISIKHPTSLKATVCPDTYQAIIQIFQLSSITDSGTDPDIIFAYNSDWLQWGSCIQFGSLADCASPIEIFYSFFFPTFYFLNHLLRPSELSSCIL